MNASTKPTATNHKTRSHAGAGGCPSHTHAAPATTYTNPLPPPSRLNLTTSLVCRWRRSRRRARGGRRSGGTRHVWRLARVRVGAARVVGLADPLQKDLADSAARDVSAVVGAHLARHDPRRLRPHRRPRVRSVVLLDERLPHRDADVLAEEDRRRALPARRRELPLAGC